MKVNWKKWYLACFLCVYVILVPPTIYALSFSIYGDWQTFAFMWCEALRYWIPILCFILLFFLMIGGLAATIRAIDDAVNEEKQRAGKNEWS